VIGVMDEVESGLLVAAVSCGGLMMVVIEVASGLPSPSPSTSTT
jgi:hypothetical protein